MSDQYPCSYPCSCGEITGAYCGHRGTNVSMVVVEHVPHYIRSADLAAGNVGYPDNGAWRLAVMPGCVEGLRLLDDWTHLVPGVRPGDYA